MIEFKDKAASQHRFAQAMCIRESVGRDAQDRKRLHKAYKRGAAWLTIIMVVCAVLGAACTAGSILCKTLVKSAVLPLSIGSLSCSIISAVAGTMTRLLVRKATKHGHLEILAIKHGYSIEALISAGLDNGARKKREEDSANSANSVRSDARLEAATRPGEPINDSGPRE